jgi:ABC-type phosphate transport system substrate-binding protein
MNSTFVVGNDRLVLLALLMAMLLAACGQPETGVTLETLPQGVQFPSDLQKKVRYDAATKKLMLAGALTPQERGTLLSLSSDPIYKRAVQALSERNHKEETSIAGEMTVGVDPALMPLAEELVKAFKAKRTNAVLFLQPMSSGEAISELIADRLRFALLLRDLKPEERDAMTKAGVETRQLKIARDAICLIVHPTQVVEDLRFSQVRDILSGKVNDWEKVGGKKLPIKVFLSAENDGRREYLKDSVLAGEKFADSAVTCKTAAEMIDAVKNTPGGIGYLTMTEARAALDLDKTKRDTTQYKVLAVSTEKFGADRVLPFQAYVVGFSDDKGNRLEYPLAYNIYYALRIGVGELPPGFAGFLGQSLEGEGQGVFLKQGLVPLRAQLKLTPPNK